MNTVEFEVIDHVIGVIRINRPAAMNALNQEVLCELRVLVDQLGARRDLRACVLTGAGPKAFVAGADIKELETLTPARARELSVTGQALMTAIEDLPFPVIAALNGFALGGGLELALSADFILAADTSKWGLPEVTLGLIPGYGGTQRLSRNVGRALARRITLSGEVFTARQGYEWGVIAQVVPPAELMPEALKLARAFAQRGPWAMLWCKDAINQGADLPLAEGLALEADLFARCFETADRVEGVRAFTEKRAPKFGDR
jgi:enoyl-CoA hydratase